ncbi:unnamed protein product, partial [Clonostachys rhizophaga]
SHSHLSTTVSSNPIIFPATMSRTALVTGASGYIALHIINFLLQDGWTVHGTVRSLKNPEKLKPILALDKGSPGTLRLFEADLLDAGSFLESMQGCDVVIHVASPCLMPEHVKDPQRQLITPALEGTRNVLESVNKTPYVRRVVLTSSEIVMRGDANEAFSMENHTIHESYWNVTSSISHNAYAYSKTLAEREAWKMADAQKRWKLVTICPSAVVGPSLTPNSASASLDLIEQIMNGSMIFGVPDMYIPMVDVREVALAHVRAAKVPEARGRYLLSSHEATGLLEIALIIRSFHKYPWIIPFWKLPDWIVRLTAPLVGVTRRYIDCNIGIKFMVDNSRSKTELGIDYRSLDESLTDHYNQRVLDKARK